MLSRPGEAIAQRRRGSWPRAGMAGLGVVHALGPDAGLRLPDGRPRGTRTLSRPRVLDDRRAGH
eukprot:429722-Pyramimonas_sp.AAC.1